MNQWSRITQILLPPVCALCGDPGAFGADLCRACRDDLPWNRHACRRCALPLPAASRGALCGECLRRPPPFDRALAPFRYAPPLDHLLLGLKHRRRLDAAHSLGGLMAGWLAQRIHEPPELILPVPLHPARLRRRGFNQSLELARRIASALELPLAGRCCRRLRDTPPQAELNAPQRRRNLRGAFEVSAPLPSRVAVIDDVMTTGSTARELTRCLRRAGAKEIEVWVCARAGRA